MNAQPHANPGLDLTELPPALAAAIRTAKDGEPLTISNRGKPLGTLTFRPSVLTGTVLEPERITTPDQPDVETQVVATTMKLSEAARRRLAAEFGPGFIVLDLLEAPASADIVLTHPVSPQLLGHLQAQFPRARVVVTEIDDQELGITYEGTVSRLLDAGASAYLPPRPIAQVAQGVKAHLAREDVAALSSSGNGREFRALTQVVRDSETPGATPPPSDAG